MCIQPAPSIASAVRLGVLPVPEHHRVAAGEQLAGLAALDDGVRGGVHELDLEVRVHAPDGRDAMLEAVLGGGLRRHRGRLGHAVADGHLAHVHLVDDAAHDLHRARRPGHDPGAQAREVERGELGVRELGDEHRRHAVERRAALLLDRLERRARLEAGRGEDHRRAVGDAAEVPHDHAEAVVQRHGDADAVVLRVAAQLADEEPVVEDVVVAERRALGEARGAARVLDVDRVVELQARGAVAQRLGVGAVGLGEQLVPVG